ncbi:sensor histidine kinase [Lederbergia wuyishanensis]|uniref:Heme sensor protein HssS n=1 Tax=Lederbergia wuyishanensis TaxID=1347903 RepID=A0ABU0D5I0_9BACI|nr:HAMP domain-containing sensor histidine kinase [Lederbergia wuyishanensis]MCJ8009815.1 HAMP domain-containing histidine kinase [Lederbergia wuyishanensis]MDQ0343671.1 signal transduction histidine kinase [Lederbergia wuyishanensis]
MKTLYVRIVLTFMIVALVSGIIAFLFSNLYYHAKLKEYNEEKIKEIANEIVNLYEDSDGMDIHEFLTSIANMNFQLYLVDQNMVGQQFGDPFRNYEIDESIIRSVLDGQTYQGISEFKSSLFVTGFFKDDLKNSIGVPIKVSGVTEALFVRPNVEKQFGEMRIIFSLILGLTFFISILLIVVFATFLVRPIKRLTKATRKVASGNYDITLDSQRSDEIGALAKDFERMAKSLQKLDEMRQEFVSNVSHEIQSPLTSIQGFTKAIRSKVVSEEEADRYLAIIEKETSRLSSLSKQLLMLSSLDKEVKGVNKSSFRLDEQIREVVLLTEWEWSKKNLRIELDLPELVIKADKQLLFQVWMNLLTNSIKFTEEDGSIYISAAVDDDIIVIVRDTGIGLSEEELPQIFDRFYMGDKSRNRTKSGSGLGLSVVKKVIDLHEGYISVTSEIGSGTEFTIRLPR